MLGFQKLKEISSEIMFEDNIKILQLDSTNYLDLNQRQTSRVKEN
jgi:hypothetical protein